MTDLIGPASAPNSTTTRPVIYRIFGAIDTWFRDCSTPASQDGTAYQADFFNGLLGQVRALIRGNGSLLTGAGPVVPEVNTSDAMMLTAVQLLIARGQPNAGADTGSADALAVGPATPWPEYKAGARIWVVKNISAGPNATAAPTLAVSGLAPVTIVRRDQSALLPGDLPAGAVFCAEFDGAYFRLVSLTWGEIAAGVQSGKWVYGAATGTGNAAAVTLFPSQAPLDGTEILVKWPAANTAVAPTLNVAGVGTKTVVRQGGGQVAIGDLAGYVPLIWDAANGWWRVNGFVASDIAALVGNTAPIKAPGPITLFVRTDGSDANNGLANSSAGAFKTFQAAYNTLVKTYSSGFYATLQAGIPGTYAGFAANNIGIASNITVSGDTSANYAGAGNYILTPVPYGDGTSGCLLSSINGVSVAGFTCDSSSLGTGSSGAVVRAGTGGNLALYGVTLKYSGSNAAINMMQVDQGGVLALDANCTVTGGTVGAIVASAGNFAAGNPMTLTMSGVTFGNFISVTGGVANLSGITFSGSGNTGQQFNVTYGEMLPPAAGLAAIPGTVAGYAVPGGGAYVPGYAGPAWSTTTLTSSVTSGTLSSATTTARYQRKTGDKTVTVNISCVLGTYSGSGSVQIQLPAALIPQSGINFVGRESAVTGKGVSTAPTGTPGLLNLAYDDNTATAASGANFILQATYEALN